MHEKVALIVDDEAAIRRIISAFCERNKILTVECDNGIDAVEIVKNNNNISIAVLDVMMPGIDGFEACRQIKNIKNIPVILLTAKSDEVDQITGFNVGCDDYVSKPFSAPVLIARIEKLINLYNNSSKTDDNAVISHRGVVIDTEAHTVSINSDNIELTRKEFETLLLLLNNKDSVISREEIYHQVWKKEVGGNIRTVDTHMRNIRAKLGECSDIIKTVHGYGYTISKED